jgi:hypothetical protein
MSAMYDRGLFDGDDLFKAYADGYKDAAQGVSVMIHLSCPHCTTCLSSFTHKLKLKLILFLHTPYCPLCEKHVIPSVTIGRT